MMPDEFDGQVVPPAVSALQPGPVLLPASFALSIFPCCSIDFLLPVKILLIGIAATGSARALALDGAKHRKRIIAPAMYAQAPGTVHDVQWTSALDGPKRSGDRSSYSTGRLNIEVRSYEKHMSPAQRSLILLLLRLFSICLTSLSDCCVLLFKYYAFRTVL